MHPDGSTRCGGGSADPLLRATAILTSVLGTLGTIGFLASGTGTGTTTHAIGEILGALFLTAGLLLSNARAGIEAIVGRQSELVHTPKLVVRSAGGVGRARHGLIELLAGLALLGFMLAEQPSAAIYPTLVIGGLLVLGLL